MTAWSWNWNDSWDAESFCYFRVAGWQVGGADELPKRKDGIRQFRSRCAWHQEGNGLTVRIPRTRNAGRPSVSHPVTSHCHCQMLFFLQNTHKIRFTSAAKSGLIWFFHFLTILHFNGWKGVKLLFGWLCDSSSWLDVMVAIYNLFIMCYKCKFSKG